MIRLLISDDSAFMRIAIRKMVESDPEIEVVGEAKTGQMCVEMAQSLKPDVITMDVEMPVMDGLEATRQVRADAALAPLPVLALTAAAHESQRRQALAAGMQDYIVKPFELDAVVATVLHHLRRPDGAPAAGA